MKLPGWNHKNLWKPTLSYFNLTLLGMTYLNCDHLIIKNTLNQPKIDINLTLDIT